MDTKLIQLQQLFADGTTLFQNGNTEQALCCFTQALKIDPRNSTLYLHSGAALHDLKRFDEAVTCYEKALQIPPHRGETHNNLGNSLIALGRFSDAVDSFSKAVTFLPLSPVPLATRATALQALGKVAEAEADCRAALSIAPDFAAAHWNLALNLLLQGRYLEGWREYEWRWQKPDFTSPIRHADVPLWDGSPLNGRTILLHAEQGFGDSIQFVRYAPLVAERGGTVVVECHPELVQLMQTVNGIYRVVPFGESLPQFSYQVPFLSLPRIFETTLENIPTCPNFSVSPEKFSKWQQLTATNSDFKVGFVWAGSRVHHNDCFRSLPVTLLTSLAERTDIKLFSLQMGDAKYQLAQPPFPEMVTDLTEQIHSFADTAALIQQLDLVISVDTAVAHLSGTLGKPIWLLLPLAPDWRWLLERSDSPWYPTMQLFRQGMSGGWGQVISSVAAVLSFHVQKNKAP